MKRELAKQIVDKINNPLLKALKVREKDNEGYGLYDVGVETEWGLIYFQRNYRDALGNYTQKDGFTLVSKSTLISQVYKKLKSCLTSLAIPFYKGDSAYNWDFKIDITGINSLRSLSDNYPFQNTQEDVELIAGIIQEYFIPECRKYLTYCNLYNNFYEPFGAQLVYDHKDHDSYVNTGMAEHYRTILKSIVKAEDFERFRAILFSHYSVEQKINLQPYFDELEKLYKDTSFKSCENYVSPKVPFHKLEDIIEAQIRAETRNLEKYDSTLLPERFALKRSYEPEKTFYDESQKAYYELMTLKAPEYFFVHSYLAALLRLRTWQNAMAYILSNATFSIEVLLTILDDPNRKHMIDSTVKVVRERPEIDRDILDSFLEESVENEFLQRPLLSKSTLDSIWYQYQLSENYKNLTRS